MTATKKAQTESLTVVEQIQQQYNELPTAKKQKEFIARWTDHINDFNRLLWSCDGSSDYTETVKELDEIKEKLNALVKRLSQNVKRD